MKTSEDRFEEVVRLLQAKDPQLTDDSARLVATQLVELYRILLRRPPGHEGESNPDPGTTTSLQ